MSEGDPHAASEGARLPLGAADPPGGSEERGPDRASATPVGPIEHVGPLRVERFEKDDGRQLILYSIERDPGSERGSRATPAPEEDAQRG